MKKLSFFSYITMLFALLSFTGATYAWFTNNAVVDTTRITASALSEAATLLISNSPNGGFTTANGVSIAPVSDCELLLPVSTPNLVEFYGMKGANPVLEKDESKLYHGRVYLTASSQNPIQNLEIWLDGADAVVTNATGDILNASRLGLKVENGPARIFYLSESHNAEDDQIYNTYIGGELQQSGSIVVGSVDSVVPDPSIPLSTCAITREGSRVVKGSEPIGKINLGEVYAVDVYFWLEGCDPDCSDHISFENLDLTLRFYGVVGEEAE
ncbi:MAG: hypothetical protein II881_09985 [Oscillospiraceae bacterium]|nr:hypothetical protein [Oscillospiraceae bacterium]